MAPSNLCFAYYCSGHGYGHATRVSAFACHLLNLPLEARPIVHIISSAPQHVFADSIARGALYRYAEIDPIIVQPLAYRVDRRKSIDVLKLFLKGKDILLEVERQWLITVKADAVLSDAAFLGCLAAKAAGIPSILITNFTFDSVYSYLSTSVHDPLSSQEFSGHLDPNSFPPSHHIFSGVAPDIPISSLELEPLVEQIHAGYRCADILFLLPGYIPIPSFSVYPPLPSCNWVEPRSNTLYPAIIEFLSQHPSTYKIYPSTPFPSSLSLHRKHKPRSVIPAPLLVRRPSSSIYTTEGRSRLLTSMGIPIELQDPVHTKILIVSFGGQVFRKPSRSRSRSRSPSASRSPSPHTATNGSNTKTINGLGINSPGLSPSLVQEFGMPDSRDLEISLSKLRHLNEANTHAIASLPLATPSHLWIPGAPPASKYPPTSPPANSDVLVFNTVPPTPTFNEADYFGDTEIEPEETRLLPDGSWIAIVCGVSEDQLGEGEDKDSGLPNGFFVAPRDVYMPDLTAMGDVLLGKLGYGTVSECIDSCMPFVYVSRPLFIEEHGLRLLLGREGVGIELSRQSYEAGDWADAVEKAWIKGRDAKIKKRADTLAGLGLDQREIEGREMAGIVIDWTLDWWEHYDDIPPDKSTE